MSESTVGDAPRYWLKEIVKKRILALVGAALTGGSRGKAYIASLGMPASRIFVGYDVVDNEFFATGVNKVRNNAEDVRKSLQLPREYFVASSGFVSKKNLARLLHAYAQYRTICGRNSWKLVGLGDGPLRKELFQQRSQLKLERDVTFPGFVQYGKLPSYYGLASAFVHASVVEQWGLVVNEALASALPVIVSNRCGCVPELVRHGENGFSFDPTDVAELARLLGLLSRASDLQRMSQICERIIREWSPARFAVGMLEAATTALAIGPLRPRRSDSLMLKALAIA
jgi:glycosyltransferase involved in cell wall biosynthesis